MNQPKKLPIEVIDLIQTFTPKPSYEKYIELFKKLDRSTCEYCYKLNQENDYQVIKPFIEEFLGIFKFMEKELGGKENILKMFLNKEFLENLIKLEMFYFMEKWLDWLYYLEDYANDYYIFILCKYINIQYLRTYGYYDIFGNIYGKIKLIHEYMYNKNETDEEYQLSELYNRFQYSYYEKKMCYLMQIEYIQIYNYFKQYLTTT